MNLAHRQLRVFLLPCVAFRLWSGCVMTPYGKPGEPTRTASVVREQTTDPNADVALPNEIAASHLLVQYSGAQGAKAGITRTKSEAKSRALEALARARKGEEFTTLVREYSDEPGAAERGGSIGKFPHHAMVKPFADAAFRLKVGEISNVVESQFGFHVILRTE